MREDGEGKNHQLRKEGPSIGQLVKQVANLNVFPSLNEAQFVNETAIAELHRTELSLDSQAAVDMVLDLIDHVRIGGDKLTLRWPSSTDHRRQIAMAMKARWDASNPFDSLTVHFIRDGRLIVLTASTATNFIQTHCS